MSPLALVVAVLMAVLVHSVVIWSFAGSLANNGVNTRNLVAFCFTRGEL